MSGKGLSFEVLVECNKTRARLSKLVLRSLSDGGIAGQDVTIDTPMFMPVGTNATIKGLLPKQIERNGARLILANTYHVGSRPGVDTVDRAGGIHEFMRWRNALLTDSGGFQMVSLSKLSEVTENGVLFRSPYDKESTDVTDEMLLTPEMATEMQHKIGSNIMMQLDDVIKTTHPDQQRMEEALHRSIRWYDRCRLTHDKAVTEDRTGRRTKQNLFPIIQGGLNPEFRRQSVDQIVARDPVGIAIGGLSGGEAKEKFIEMVSVSTESLPPNKPRYLMGVGLAIDMLMCVAFGVDLFDCVFPTRTARFGCALIGYGKELNLRSPSLAADFGPLDKECDCKACLNYTRSYIHHLMRDKNTVGCHLLSEHNIRFQMRFMKLIRDSIRDGVFEQFICNNLKFHFGDNKHDYPEWITKAVNDLNLNI
ncbi:queuine tRNA-ribosyltransferase catalytic subunit 1-like [Oppia nitens]|uniref:queuine tRNA-ribosyltransferase catalytic subunit 1-like n=1 Tax=Oppia nitens TaxID=1686743 RepID=UPI0023D9E1F1|nr:queuine tRNA-ribosyltransferase catalytic subunit 1-like [Oppia nitens]